MREKLAKNGVGGIHDSPFAVEAAGMSCYFGKRLDVCALDEVTVAINAGEQLCIAGPSGSGKTTFLNIVGGLQAPTSGHLAVQGRDFARMTAKEVAVFRARNIGFVFQSPNLIPVLSAFENVLYALELVHPELSREARVQRTDEMMRQVGLGEKQHLRPAQLSGGECQRVAIARAVVKRPSMILADEPTSHLDDRNTEMVKALFTSLGAGQKTTVLIATHDSRLLSGASRIIRFEAGRTVTADSLQYERVGVSL